MKAMHPEARLQLFRQLFALREEMRRTQSLLAFHCGQDAITEPFGALKTELAYVLPNVQTRMLDVGGEHYKRLYAVSAALDGTKETDILDN